MFESDGKLSFSQNVGIRLAGASSRLYPQLSLRMYAREEYGDKNMKYKFFENNTISCDDSIETNSYKKILLRSGGNDCINAKLRDVLAQTLVSDRNFDTQANQPSIVFLNGRY